MFGLRRLFSQRSRFLGSVRPTPVALRPEAGRPAVLGRVEQCSTRHVAGWVLDPTQPDAAPDLEIVVGGTEAVIARGRAALGTAWLRQPPAAGYGFHLVLPAPLTETERQCLEVRHAGGGGVLPTAEAAAVPYRPIRYVALDIVDNCNLRCPFCLYDYTSTHRTNMMSDEVFEAAMRLIPYVGDGHFWLSCLHEPTMHPKFAEFIERIPFEYHSNIFYTSNFSRRMPQAYYDLLGRSGLHHINVSIESRDPALYERMRKGAKHRIFMECWDKLLAACKSGSAPPRLHYIMMAYKANLTEIPELVAYLREERMAAHVDVRYTFDMAHIDGDFKSAEYLEVHEWHWLAAQLARFPVHEVNLSLPPGVPAASAGPAIPVAAVAPPAEPAPPPQPVIAPGEFEFRVSYDGRACIAPIYAAHRPNVITDLAVVNILDLHDPVDYLRTLSAA